MEKAIGARPCFEASSTHAEQYYRADDLIPEENETVLLALKRLPPKEAYDRIFRLRRAFQVFLLYLFPHDMESDGLIVLACSDATS